MSEQVQVNPIGAGRPQPFAALRRLRAWPYLQLMRPPNLVTSAADILAGFAAAGAEHRLSSLPFLIGASVLLYAGGVVLNDVFDARLDSSERPERPIPSGRVPLRDAALFGGVLLSGGIILATCASMLSGLLASAIAMLVIVYNWRSKHNKIAGPIVMGLCRSFNLLLGISALPLLVAQRWYLALIPLAYIAAITAISTGEVHGGERKTGTLALVLVGIVLTALLALGFTPGFRFIYLLPFVLLLAWRVVPPFWRAYRTLDPMMIRKAVKAGVLSLIVLDAAVAGGYAGLWFGLGVLVLLLLASWIARPFAVT